MIPLVRARYAANFVVAMQRSGIAYRLHLDKAGLSEQILDKPDAMIPAHQLWELAHSAALRSGKLDLGWDAGEAASLDAYGSFSRVLFSRQTVYERLLNFCAAARAEYSEADFRVRSAAGQLFFIRGPIVGEDVQVRQVELYVLTMMLTTVRSVLGRTWQPPFVALQTFGGPDIEHRFDRKSTRLAFDRRETVVVIAESDLEHSVDAVFEPFDNVDEANREDQLLGTIETLVGSYLDDRRLSVNFLSKICGINSRKLQRMLESRGTSFSEILTRRRLSTASDFLKKTDMPIAEIAYNVGYSSQAHFSRAFRNRTGTTPYRYRRGAMN